MRTHTMLFACALLSAATLSAPAQPSITGQPQTVMTVASMANVFTVEASSTPPTAYQGPGETRMVIFHSSTDNSNEAIEPTHNDAGNLSDTDEGDSVSRAGESPHQSDGNTNNWLKLVLIGTRSNRSAIGSIVRLNASLWGTMCWQRHDVFIGDLRPNFGLGDATNAEIVRIEWPSGTVQELRNVAANQILTVTEPIRLQFTAQGQIQFRSWIGQSFVIECSTNLVEWNSLATLTNLTGLVQFTDLGAPGRLDTFYRVRPR